MSSVEVNDEKLVVGFQPGQVQPPSDLYVDRDDTLFITSYNSATGVRIDLRGILLRSDGVAVPVEISQTPNTDRTAKTSIEALSRGFLLSMSVFLGAGSAKRGQCYVQVGIARGRQTSRFTHRIIAQGYVGTGVNICWPGDRLVHPLEGPGFIRSIVGTDPAAGAGWSETVPTGARWRMQTLKATLVTDATVANRRVGMSISDGAATYMRLMSEFDQTAGLTHLWHFMNGVASSAAAITNIARVAIPHDLILGAGFILNDNTSNRQAGDDWGAPTIIVEEWIEP